MKLRLGKLNEVETIMEIIDGAKKHLKEQGIDQWQTGYPDKECILGDIEKNKGYLIINEDEIYGYLCIDFDGEPAYDNLNGEWESEDKYVVVHRMAFSEKARSKKLSNEVFKLVEELSKEKGIFSFRVDTDDANKKMQHVLKKNGFIYRGTIWFDNSEKIAFDKKIV